MRIDQLIDTAAPGDAIMNDALALRAQLRQFVPSEIVCDRSAHPGLEPEIISTPAYARQQRSTGTSDDVLIVHCSIGNEELHRFVMSRSERLVVRYHNVTPGRYFVDYDPVFAGFLDLGREQIAEIVPRAVAAIPDSTYNADELVALDMARCRMRVVPPLFPYDGFASSFTAPSARTWPAPYAGGPSEGPLLLFVGQLLPHKRPDLLIAAFHVLRTHLDPRARLRVVGPVRNTGYGAAVRRMAEDLRLPVEFTGSVSQAALEASFREAHVLVTLSEHEGFCVPAVEAMAIGLPVVARAFGAIPETVADGALLVDPDDDAFVIAEAIHTVVADLAMADALAWRGRARAAQLAPSVSAGAFLRALDELL